MPRALVRMACLVVLAGAFASAGCDGPGASLRILAARASREPDGRVAVEIDLLASEGLGGNVGTYCTRATFDGQPDPVEVCAADLEDGDTKTVRLTSESTALRAGAEIKLRVRVAAVDVGRSLVAP